MRSSKQVFAAAFVFLMAIVSFGGCDNESPLAADGVIGPVEVQILTKVSTNGDDSQIAELIGDRALDVGDVYFDDVDLDSDGTADALEVRYTTADGWKLVSTQLWVGPSLSDMPDTRKGDPKPCRFPYQSRRISDTTLSITIPFEAMGYQCGDTNEWYVAAHAIVRKQEGRRKHRTVSAWSGDTRFRAKRGHNATYTTIVINCDTPPPPPPPPPSTVHPAFSYSPDALCLSDLSFGMPGWTNFIVDAGTYTHVLYADPTGCDPTALTAVGTVTLVYDGVSTATVTFETVGPYTMKLAAVYYGASEAPPGSDPITYPLVHTLTGSTLDTFTITDFSQFSFFVAQASVEGF